MKISWLAIFSFFVSAASLAQQPLPKNLEPLSSPITISYTPKFDARCTTKTYEKKSSDLFGTRTSANNNYSIYEDASGELKYAGGGEYGAGKFVRVVVGLKPGGIGFASAPPILETNEDLSPDAKATFQTMIEGGLKNGGAIGFIGKPLTQGLSSAPDFCQLFSRGNTHVSSGGMTVVGSAVIEGRKSLVLSGGQSFKCLPVYGFGGLTMTYKGWQAIDVQSGLPIASSSVIEDIRSTGEIIRSTEETQCLITGSLVQTQQPTPSTTLAPKTSELRLIELKALLDKGLITQQQFEQKRTEIVRDL
jgi:hypothetical protein